MKTNTNVYINATFDLQQAAIRHHNQPNQENLDALIRAARIYAEALKRQKDTVVTHG